MANLNGRNIPLALVGTKVTKDGVYQGEWSADFAEAERQKSKNLFNINKVSLHKTYANGVIDSNTEIMTLYQNANYTSNKLSDFADLEVGKTYTLSFSKSVSSKNYIYSDNSIIFFPFF